MRPVSSTSTIRSRRHSRLIGDAARRGGFTSAEGSVLRPDSSSSLTLWGSSRAPMMTASMSSGTTTLTTNSPVSSMFRHVSFFEPSRFVATAIEITGGSEETPLKKLKGARFVTPSRESVVTKAMGRGMMHEIISRYESREERDAGSICMSVQVREELSEELDLLLDAGEVGGFGRIVDVALEVGHGLAELFHLDVEHAPLAEVVRRPGAQVDVHVDPAHGAGELAASGVDPAQVGQHPREDVPRRGDLEHLVRDRRPAGAERVEQLL